MGDYKQDLLSSHYWLDTGMHVKYCKFCDAKVRLAGGEMFLEQGEHYCPVSSQKHWKYMEDTSDDPDYWKFSFP
jgi:ribosomal protein L24E